MCLSGLQFPWPQPLLRWEMTRRAQETWPTYSGTQVDIPCTPSIGLLADAAPKSHPVICPGPRIHKVLEEQMHNLNSRPEQKTRTYQKKRMNTAPQPRDADLRVSPTFQTVLLTQRRPRPNKDCYEVDPHWTCVTTLWGLGSSPGFTPPIEGKPQKHKETETERKKEGRGKGE